MKISSRFNSCLKIGVFVVLLSVFAGMAGYISSTLSAEAAGPQYCDASGVTARWTGEWDDVTCEYDSKDGSYNILNNRATEVALSGEAITNVDFYSRYNGFESLKLDGLTGNDCLSGDGCVDFNTEGNNLTINIANDNKIGSLHADADEVNIVGEGSLEANHGITNEVGTINLNADVSITGGADHDPIQIALIAVGDINILGRNLEIVIDKMLWAVPDYGVIHTLGSLSIADGANVTITLDNSSPDEDIDTIMYGGTFTLGSSIVAKRDGVVIDPQDFNDLFVPAGESAIFTFGVASPTVNDDTIIVDSFQDPIEIEIADLISNDEDVAGLNFQITSVTNGFVDVNSANGIIEFYPDDVSLPMSLTYVMTASGEVEPNVYHFGNHYYQFVDTELSWNDAYQAAQSASLVVNGETLTGGYLVEINNAEEDIFLTQYISESAWTSGNDITTEGQWYWGKGEIPGKLFWQGYGPGDSSEPGSGIDGVYNNWQGIEPNDESGEDCLIIDYGNYYGAWNDIPCDTSANYIIEFEDVTAEPAVTSNEATVDISFLSGDLSCTVNGMTAEWIGSVLDVYCGGSNFIENYGASEITLTGEANNEVHFTSYYDGFEVLNLSNLTENTPIADHGCGAGIGCIYFDLNYADELDINIIGDNQIRGLSAYDISEVSLMGSGSLSALFIQAWGYGNSLNLNTNIYLLTMPHFGGDILMMDGGTLNILGGSLMIEGFVNPNDMDALVYANDINITNGANITIDVTNINTADDMNIFYFGNPIVFGDKIIGTRDGVEIDDLYDLDNYIVGADSSTVITFGAPVVVDPTDPTSPSPIDPGTDLTAPDTGFFGGNGMLAAIALFAVVISGAAVHSLWRLRRQNKAL